MLKISEASRRDIRDLIITEKIAWSGRLEEADFLSRLYDVRSMLSNDGRFSNAYGDIHQHRTMNFDWENDWVFDDSRFSLMGCADDAFLKFLCETIHPAVRASSEETEKLLGFYNSILAHDGFRLIEARRMSDRPVFVGKYIGVISSPGLNAVKEKPLIVDSTYVAQLVKRMEGSLEGDPALAIGSAKELLETICKTILGARGETYSKTADAPELVRQTAKVLKLTPNDVSDRAKAADTIKLILGHMATIPQGIAELRNLYGTGHGKHAKTKGLQPRHARLAVGVAATLATFLIETHEEKE